MILDSIKLTPILETLRLEKISDATYFSEKYSGYISNSRLGLLNPKQEGTPEKFFAEFKQQGYVAAFELGSAVHSIVLQNEYFKIAEDLSKPSAKLGAMADSLFPVWASKNKITVEDVIKSSDIVDYYKGKINKDKYENVIKSCTPYWEARQKFEFNLEENKEIIYLNNKTREIALSCIESLQSNKYVQELLHPTGIITDPISENEQAILLDVKAECPNGKSTILRLKSKLDNYTIDTENNIICVNDVKTIGKMLSEADNNINRFHYHRELGMYIYLLKLCASKFYNLNNPKIQANYLFVSTVPNFYSKVRPATYNELVYGFKEFRKLLQYTAYLMCYKNYSFDAGKYQL